MIGKECAWHRKRKLELFFIRAHEHMIKSMARDAINTGNTLHLWHSTTRAANESNGKSSLGERPVDGLNK